MQRKPILIKLFLNKEEDLPRGIEQKKHHRTEDTLGLRIDSGMQVIDNLHLSTAEGLIDDLSAQGYHLIGAHWFERQKNKNGKKTVQYVLVLNYDTVESDHGLQPETLGEIFVLTGSTWFTAHVWENQDNATVNLIGYQPNGTAKNGILLDEKGFYAGRVLPEEAAAVAPLMVPALAHAGLS